LQDKQLDLWKHYIPKRKGLEFKMTDRICANHFTKDSFVDHSFINEKGIREEFELQVKRLVANAVPTIFTDLPKYLVKVNKTRKAPADRSRVKPIKKSRGIPKKSRTQPVTDAEMGRADKENESATEDNLLQDKIESTEHSRQKGLLPFGSLLESSKSADIIMPSSKWICNIFEEEKLISISKMKIKTNAPPTPSISLIFSGEDSNAAPTAALFVESAKVASGPHSKLRFATVKYLNKFLQKLDSQYKCCSGAKQNFHDSRCDMLLDAKAKFIRSTYCEKLKNRLRSKEIRNKKAMTKIKQKYTSLRQRMQSLKTTVY